VGHVNAGRRSRSETAQGVVGRLSFGGLRLLVPGDGLPPSLT